MKPASASADNTMRVIAGATHYYVGQPELMREAIDLCIEWMLARGFLADR